MLFTDHFAYLKAFGSFHPNISMIGRWDKNVFMSEFTICKDSDDYGSVHVTSLLLITYQMLYHDKKVFS